jgi:hypothetical protein
MAKLVERHERKYRFDALTYMQLKTDRLITFSWGFMLAIAPLLINLIVFIVWSSLGKKHLVDYPHENFGDATFTGFSIAAVALTNSCFNSLRPTSYRGMRLGTHLSIIFIVLIACVNLIMDAICSGSVLESDNYFFTTACLTGSIALISWVLQILYIQDITYQPGSASAEVEP